jgi:PAS domain S-box-containing protein
MVLVEESLFPTGNRQMNPPAANVINGADAAPARAGGISHEQLLLRTLIDNLPDCIYAKDAAGRKTMANPADLKNLRCQTEAEAVGKSDFDLFPKEIAEQFWADDQKVIQGEPVINREEYFLNDEGEKRWLLTSKLPLRDPTGKIVGLMGIGRDITARKQAEARLEEAHKQLLEVSRQAGMSEVATSVLHNVGNVLNSVNVSSSLISEKIRTSKVPNLAKAVALMRAHESDLAGFLTNDPKGRQLLDYLLNLAAHLAQEQAEILSESDSLAKKIMHIKEIVAMQQNYAKSPGILESLSGADLLEDAVRMNIGSMERHRVKVVREYAEAPPILVEKHKVLQILVNLIRNAKYACDNSGREDKQITLRITHRDNRVNISVADNGIGIAAENMTRIFSLGFTTKKNGHGFGLHSGALAAKELGGKLVAFSEGTDRGATFTLELPIQKAIATA